MLKYIFVLLTVISFSGCCWMSKRSCFPACPPLPVVEVQKCRLPGPVTLPPVKRDTSSCPQSLVCYDSENAAKIAERESKLKDWVKEAKIRCGSPSNDAGVGGPDAR